MNNIVVIGDIILDQYHFGEVKRLNPESPVPLINIKKSENRLGGAANVAANIISLGGTCTLIGNIGEDVQGDIVQNLCQKLGIHLHPLKTKQPTITKIRYVEDTYSQQLLRADFEEEIDVNDSQIQNAIQLIKETNPDIILCSDYTKGVLSQQTIHQICTHFKDKKIIVDTKPKKFDLYKNIYFFKPNFKEFREIVGHDIENTDTEIEHYGKNIASKYQTNFVITRGAKGATIILTSGEVYHMSTHAQQVFDVSGAGDTFFAGIGVQLAEGSNLQNAVSRGNKASGKAVEKIGTAIVYRNEL